MLNKVILMGRLTRDPDVRYSQSQSGEQMCIARYTLAVDRRFARRGQDGNDQSADFIGCVAFGKQGEFAEKYLHQGTKIAVTGRIQTGSYTNKDGQTVYTTDVVCTDIEFAESKAAAERSAEQQAQTQAQPAAPVYTDSGEGFINIPDGIDEELPFK
jgi:single-strand DNA-binding protein